MYKPILLVKTEITKGKQTIFGVRLHKSYLENYVATNLRKFQEILVRRGKTNSPQKWCRSLWEAVDYMSTLWVMKKGETNVPKTHFLINSKTYTPMSIYLFFTSSSAHTHNHDNPQIQSWVWIQISKETSNT